MAPGWGPAQDGAGAPGSAPQSPPDAHYFVNLQGAHVPTVPSFMPALLAAMQACDSGDGRNNRVGCGVNLGIVYALACVEAGITPEPYRTPADGGD